MNCEDLRANLRDWVERGSGEPAPAARAHLDSCRDCRLAWDRERRLTVRLAELRRLSAGEGASPRVVDLVLASQPRPAGIAARAWLAAAASLAAVVLLWLFTTARKSETSAPASRTVRTPVYSDFIPLSAAGLDPAEAAHVIRIRLPRGELRRFGLPVGEGLERVSIEADVVIGQDGIARAVRFVQ